MTKSGGCLVGAGLGAGLVMLLILVSVPGSHTTTRPAVQKSTVQPAQDIKPALQIEKILAAKGKAIGTVLAQQLGTGASVRYEKSSGVMQWVGRRGALTLEVLPDKGRVLSVVVVFRPPVRDWAAALATVGLDPRVGPTKEAPFQLHWQRAFPDIDEVHGMYPDGGKPAIKQLSITPDKAAADLWYKGQ